MSAEAVEHHIHYFAKDTGVWTCQCGAMADRHGKVVAQVTEKDLLRLLD